MTFKTFITRLQNILPAIVAAVTSIIAVTALDKIIPEPLNSVVLMRFSQSITIIALVVTFTYRKWILKNFKKILISAIILLILTIILNAFFVILVEYNDGFSKYVLSGLSVEKEYMGWGSLEELIRQTGTELGDLRKVFVGYDIIYFSYIIITFSFIFLFVFCLGGLIKDDNDKIPNV